MQLLEGVDNEITLGFLFLTGAAAIAVPWYLFRPNRRETAFNGARINQTSQSEGEQGQSSDATASVGSTVEHGRSNRDSVERRTFTEGSPNVERDENVTSRDSASMNEDAASTRQNSDSDNDAIITIKIKHHSVDTLVSVPKTMTLIDFKRHCYNAEMEQGKNVRLIYNGRILAGDHYTLEFLGIKHGFVIHAQISEHQGGAESHGFSDTRDIDIGFLFVPMMLVAFILGWTLVLTYGDLFSTSSIVILSFLSGVFVLIAYIL